MSKHTWFFYKELSAARPGKTQRGVERSQGDRQGLLNLPGAGSAAPPGDSSGCARIGKAGRAVGEELLEPALDARLDATLDPTLGASG